MTSKCIKVCAVLTALALLLAMLFAWVVEDSWTQEHLDTSNAVIPKYDAGNLLKEQITIEQVLNTGCTDLHTFSFWPRKSGEAEGELLVEFLQDERVLVHHYVNFSLLTEYVPYTLQDLNLILDRDKPLTVRFSATQVEADAFISVYYGDTVSVAGRFEAELGDASGLSVGDIAIKGQLALGYAGIAANMQIMQGYWILVTLLIILMNVLTVWLFYCRKTGRRSRLLHIVDEVRQYSFLTSRLVSRNFNTKYRQSVLGVLWSILNPLMTTAVLYFVFSTIFRAETENYIIYLLSGIIVWNAFVEAVNLGMESITGNASIINKVYVPRYIYPISNVFSALINLLISLIPLVLISLVTGLQITKAYLILPIAILFLFMFASGMALFMATSNVFFRDTRFLWGVLTMMWTYLTPIFYTETIIPEAYLSLYHANPMYQFLLFFRCIFIQGVTPQPINYLYAFIAAVVPLALGIWFFSRNQNKFVLYL